jgi:catechol 2,3-dioxygenase-like lactoylglutathione lyase family enzyme
MPYHLRIARPVTDLARTADMYCRGLGYRVLGSFENHAGFDGIMVGVAGDAHHFEFTQCREHPITPSPTQEDLTVLYVPAVEEWRNVCERMAAAGFRPVASFNPYWDDRGRTFEDPDGYRIVLQQSDWNGSAG